MWKDSPKKTKERERDGRAAGGEQSGEDGGDILGVGQEVKPLRAQPESVNSLWWVSLKA